MAPTGLALTSTSFAAPSPGVPSRLGVSRPVLGLLKWRRPVFGGGGGGSGSGKKKKFISREEEPEEYWQTAAEKEGRGPMSTPLPYIAMLSVLTPFFILAVAYANGWLKAAAR